MTVKNWCESQEGYSVASAPAAFLKLLLGRYAQEFHMLPLDHTTRVVPNCPKFDRVLLLSGSSLQQTPSRYLLVYPPTKSATVRRSESAACRRQDSKKAQLSATPRYIRRDYSGRLTAPSNSPLVKLYSRIQESGVRSQESEVKIALALTLKLKRCTSLTCKLLY